MERIVSATLPPHTGPLLPKHRHGHCGFNPRLDGKNMCNAPAERHFWVGNPDGAAGIDAWCGWACEEHWQVAYDLVHPADWHAVETVCLDQANGTKWRWSTADQPGFCYLEGDTDIEAIAALDLVAAGSISSHSRPEEDR